MPGSPPVKFIIVLLLFTLHMLLHAPRFAAAQPGFWYDGKRKIPLRNLDRVENRARHPQGFNDQQSKKNNGAFYVCYPQEWTAGQITALEESYHLNPAPRQLKLPKVRLYQQIDATQALLLANRIYEENDIDCAAPLWQKQLVTKDQAGSYDPLFPMQWSLDNRGQCGNTAGHDISAPNAWPNSLGEGITIAVVDNGVELDHPDLIDNLLINGHFDFVGQAITADTAVHGTAVAGIAASRGFNDIGLIGVAPRASLLSLRILPEAGQMASEGDEAAALYYTDQNVDIYNNSWGPAEGTDAAFEGPSALVRNALTAGVSEGRNGLGSIYVWAAGNGGRADDSNLDGYANSRQVIAVTATNCLGSAASYAEPGSNILLNAPSGDGMAGLVTTDKMSASGYNTGTNSADLTDADYTNTFSGTSAAAATVSGVAALVLQANPLLNWREVQQILALSTEQNDVQDEGWRANGAGLLINEKYGYGRVNAEQSVRLASSWHDSISAENSARYSRQINRPIPDGDPHGLTETMMVNESLRLESVMVTVDIPSHSYWGDLSMYLTSPQGTRVRLVKQNFLSPSALTLGYNQWTFKDALHLGELSAGPWTLEIIDEITGDAGFFGYWALELFGTPTPDQAEKFPVSCAAQSAEEPLTAYAGALFLGVNHHGSSFASTASGTAREDYQLVTAVRADMTLTEQLTVARYDRPGEPSLWFALSNNGWQTWDGEIATLPGYTNPAGQTKIAHAGKLSAGSYAIWNGFRSGGGEVFYCQTPVTITVTE